MTNRNAARLYEVIEPGQDLSILREVPILHGGPSDCCEPVIIHLEQWREQYASLIVVAETRWWKKVESCITPELRKALLGVVYKDLYGAPEAEILEAIRPVLEPVEHRQEYAA